MKLAYIRSAAALVAGVLAAGFTPPEPVLPSQWVGDNLVVPDGEYAGERVDLALTPYLREPLDMLGPDSPVNQIAVMKSAQTGFTLMLIGSLAHSVDRDPCDMMVVQPTDSALTDFNSQKLGRAIEKTPALARKVKPQTARSGKASTTYEKKFGDHSLVLAIATSSADLSSKTIKKLYLDEIDRYPPDVDGQGRPTRVAAKRQTMFLLSGTWKRAYISTPVIKGDSEIEDYYEGGDQRLWHVKCPHCGPGKFVFEEGPNFKFNRSFPHEAYYVAPCCGSVIEGWQKNELIRDAEAQGAGWIAQAPGAGKYPSYHFSALSSPFVPWDEIAKEIVEAGDDPVKLKPLYNLTFGRTFEVKGNAPDHVLLMARRESYTRGHVPPGALLLTVAADVQMRGIYYEVLAVGSDRQSWVVEADYLDGATSEVDGGAFAALSELYAKRWPDAYGHEWIVDEFGIDSGYRSHVVYEFTRRHPGTKALKGLDGWGTPALGVARDMDVDYRGRRIKGGAKVRGVGTWPLKATFYALLAREPMPEGAGLVVPTGYCHFGSWLDENYFKQITSEYLADEKIRGRPVKRWKPRAGQENHFLDCRIYNMALVEAYLASYTADDWARAAKRRGIPEDLIASDLFAPRAFAAAAAAAQGAPAKAQAQDGREDYFAKLAQLNKGVS